MTIEPQDFYLIVVAIVTGFINTVAGGGSVIVLPVLIMFFGLPVQVANGTNRVGIIAQTIFSALGFRSKKVTPFQLGTTKSIVLGVITLIGSIIGANIAIDFPDDLFKKVLSFIMIIVLVLTILKPKTAAVFKNKSYGYYLSLTVFFLIGIYAGFIQAGTGFLLILSLSYFFNLSLVKSNAIKTLIAFFIIVGAIYVFAMNDQINYKYGLFLAIGNAIGGWIASRWSVKKGDRTIQIFMIIAVSVMAIKLWFY